MNLGESAGGLPPDSVVEKHDDILAATQAAIDRWHDPSFGAMTRIAVAPCSPFSVTADLMRDSAELARQAGVRLHTHLAETTDEEDFCRATYGRTPAQYAEDLGWLGPDVWLAHCVHLSDEAIGRFAATATGVAHCPTSNGRLGSGIAPVRALLDAGAPVGLGVDGAASNESGRMIGELHQALLAARLRGGPLALSARQSLQLATMGGARCLGRTDELGSLEAGKLADVALWQTGGLAGAGIADPVCTLVFGAPSLDRLWVGGRPVVTPMSWPPGRPRPAPGLAAGSRRGPDRWTCLASPKWRTPGWRPGAPGTRGWPAVPGCSPSRSRRCPGCWTCTLIAGPRCACNRMAWRSRRPARWLSWPGPNCRRGRPRR
jgi:cytosine/adenosine deaminase-related metal-dependent hydrolase